MRNRCTHGREAVSARRCPALFISAPASGQGKTTVAAALAGYHRRRGQRVRLFKTGPDFLDPLILERASDEPVYQLDLWMGGEAHCRRLLYDAAGSADLILIEGSMGLYDGEPSSADLATRFAIPILAVIDGSAMAQTFGAVAAGLARYRPDVDVIGVVANRVAGAGHYQMLAHSLPAELAAFGWLGNDPGIALPDRHLGLHQPDEIADLANRLAHAAERFVPGSDALPPAVTFTETMPDSPPARLAGVRVAVARDAAFSFLYRANLDALRAMGAAIHFFSPLTDSSLPPADSLYLPGGYPELHLRALADNRAMQSSIRAHHAAGRPILAECGGMLYLLESLTALDGTRRDMVGLLPGQAVMQPELAAIALQTLALPEGTLRGHTFHHSRVTTAATPIGRGVCPNGGRTAEATYRDGRLTVSYIHAYFASNPDAVARVLAP